MEQKIIEAKATSLDEARDHLKAQLSEGLLLLSEEVLSDGTPKIERAYGETTEKAYLNAASKMPSEEAAWRMLTYAQ